MSPEFTSARQERVLANRMSLSLRPIVIRLTEGQRTTRTSPALHSAVPETDCGFSSRSSRLGSHRASQAERDR